MSDYLFYSENINWYLKRRLIDATEYDPLTHLNRFQIPAYEEEMQGTKQFVFMTRPDLNLMESKANLVNNVARIPFISDLWRNHKYGKTIIKSLQQDGSDFKSPFLTIISNSCKGYSPIDSELDSVERGETYFGHKIVYAKHNIKTRAAGQISLQFKDNKNLVLYKTLTTWFQYMEHVSIGHCSPRRKYIQDAILDYAVSFFYLVTTPDMRKIIYWEKLVGLFPLNTPESAFAYQIGNSIEPEYTVNFKYSMKDRPMNPNILLELNQLAKTTGRTGNFVPNWDVANKVHGDTAMLTPFVEYKDDEYILRWCK